MLTSTIEDKGDIDKVIGRFIKKLNGCIASSFDKKRVKADKRQHKENLYDKRRKLKNKTEAIAEASDKNFDKLKEELNKLKTDEGKINSKQLWKFKKAFCPKVKDAPCAMNDKSGT